MKYPCVGVGPLLALLAFLATPPVRAELVISELMYHPVEQPVFDRDGAPAFDLTEDLHEFIEIHNPGAVSVNLNGWKLSGGVDYNFPIGALIEPGAYLVVAKDRNRLAALTPYGLAASDVYGPFNGQLSNQGDTVRLKNGNGATVDSVTYSASFPWAISADGLGAGDEWTGIDSALYQYRGRSLERVSFTHSPNDPANWMASPMPGEPSPGRANTVNRLVPQPIVIGFKASQASDRQIIIRSNQPVRIECTFSASGSVSNVAVEYFIDDINLTNEAHTTLAMTDEGARRYTALVPGRANGSLVRYRIRADRDSGDGVVSPRPDDPFAWHAYFVTPVRSSTNDAYDLFISTKSISQLSVNLSDNPNSGYLPASSVIPNGRWNNEEPGVFVHNGVVRDVRTRYNGSFYRRSADRQSYKVALPRYNLLDGQSTLLVTDKDFITEVGHALFREAGLPTAHTRPVDLYVNKSARLPRLEIEESDEHLLQIYHQEQAKLHPGQPVEVAGRYFKSSGILEDRGPYGRGDGTLLKTNLGWTPLQRYEWVYSLKNSDWKGYADLKELLDQMWLARGTRAASNVVQLRAYFEKYWDIDDLLTYVAVRNWMATWDDTVHNFFLWERDNGKWCILPWDFDADMGASGSAGPTVSIFRGEEGNADNTHGTHPIKDSFYKALREEYKQRLFFLNNTFLHPDNITAMGFGVYRPWVIQRLASVNLQCKLGVFQRPNRPTNQAPATAQFLLPPATLKTSAYSHSTNTVPAHATTTWRIRSVGGSYFHPVYSLTSSNDLTQLPLPFDQLTFGQAYYWQCVYTDTNGHPSLPSEETSFAFGSATTPLKLLAIDSATLWKYHNAGAVPGPDWMQPVFDDGSWASGPALLGVDNGVLPEPLRTPIPIGKTSYYFRVHFPFSGNPQKTVLQLRQVIDDGVVIYLNGEEIRRTRITPGPVAYQTTAVSAVNDAVYEGPFLVPAELLKAGDNVLAAEVHQAATAGGDMIFGASLEATATGVSGDLVLNEVMAINRSSVTNAGKNPDWIELFNNGAEAMDLGGLTLSDNPLVPAKYVFPQNTLIPPQGHLVIWCDKEAAAPGLHTGFALSGDGQAVTLFRLTAAGYSVVDSISFGLQIADFTIGRVPDGIGAWQLNAPTPGLLNRAEPVAGPGNLRINEWMASPDSGDDWFELYNPEALTVSLGGLYLTDDFNNRTQTRIASLSYIAANDYAQFFADEQPGKGAAHVNFKLSSDGETIALFATNATYLIDWVSFGQQTKGVSEGRLPDGGDSLAFFASTASPKGGNLVYQPMTNVWINEVLTHSSGPLEDAIELYNPTGASVDASYYWLSDDKDRLGKFRIPAGTVLASQGFLVLYENQFNSDPNSPSSFSLSSAHGDQLYLSSGDAAGHVTNLRASVKFGAADDGVSFGRLATSVGLDFSPLRQRTFGADHPATRAEFRTGHGLPNALPQVGPVAISEIMYHPPDEAEGDNTRDEFIELYNFSANAVPLFDFLFPTNRWRLGGAVEFDFSANVSLAAGGHLLVVSFDPVADLAALAGFRQVYGLGLEMPIFGPYRPSLDNKGGDITLLKPGVPLGVGAEEGFVPYILVEHVKFTDGAPWPGPADGAGLSLQRKVAADYANDPINWLAAGPTPGRNTTGGPLPVISKQPQPYSSVAEGTDISFSVSAAGPGKFGYQWRWNGYDIPGANQPVLALVALDPASSGQYSAVVFNESGFVISDPATLIVNWLPIIIDGPSSQTIPAGVNATFSVLASVSGTASFQWTFNGDLISDATNSDFTVTSVGLFDNGDYAVRITDVIGTAVSEPASLKVLVKPVILAQPQSVMAVVGDTVSFSITVSPVHPSLPVGYRWRRNSATIVPFQSGRSVLTLTNVQLTNAGGYSVVITNAALPSGTLSASALLTVLADADRDRIPDDWEIEQHFDPNDPNDGALDADGDTMTNYEEYVAGTDPHDPSSYLKVDLLDLAAGGAGATQLEFLAVSNRTYSVEFKESLSAGHWSKLADLQSQPSNRVERVADSFPRTAGRLFRLVTPQLPLPPNAKPVILVSPRSVRVASGKSVQLEVQAAGQGLLKYQWRRNGVNLPGATSPVLMLPPLNASVAGAYTVVVTDWGGSEESEPAIVSIQE